MFPVAQYGRKLKIIGLLTPFARGLDIMVTVTDIAADKIKTMIEDQENPDLGLRVMIAGGGCSGFQYRLAFDKQATDNDQIIEQNGIKVFVDNKSAIYLMGAELDYVEGLMGAGFKVVNPNAKGTCGCGESFHV
jgi:iron-sulfur cluster insertion protein